MDSKCNKLLSIAWVTNWYSQWMRMATTGFQFWLAYILSPHASLSRKGMLRHLELRESHYACLLDHWYRMMYWIRKAAYMLGLLTFSGKNDIVVGSLGWNSLRRGGFEYFCCFFTEKIYCNKLSDQNPCSNKSVNEISCIHSPLSWFKYLVSTNQKMTTNSIRNSLTFIYTSCYVLTGKFLYWVGKLFGDKVDNFHVESPSPKLLF